MDTEGWIIPPQPQFAAFWANERKWPRPEPAFVFLARAMKLIGQALFPDTWNGAEPWAGVSIGLPSVQTPPGSPQSERAHELLGEALEPIELHGIVRSTRVLADEEWDAARAISLAKAVKDGEAYERWHGTCDYAVSAFLDGRLTCLLRDGGGGGLVEQTADLWRTERWWTRFALCQIDAARPFQQTQPAPPAGQLIYVSAQSLNSELDHLKRAAAERLTRLDIGMATQGRASRKQTKEKTSTEAVRAAFAGELRIAISEAPYLRGQRANWRERAKGRGIGPVQFTEIWRKAMAAGPKGHSWNSAGRPPKAVG